MGSASAFVIFGPSMPLDSSSHSFGTAKISKPTIQSNATKHLLKAGAAQIHCSGLGDKNGPISSTPTTESLAKTSLFVRKSPSKDTQMSMKFHALRRTPRGFGPKKTTKNKKKTTKKKKKMLVEDLEEDEDEEYDEEREDSVIPEIVNNRMMKRIGVSVGAPLALGLTFFPIFYYMKVVLKWNVPDWLPFITSFFTFGSAALGISYGIMSTSWDPLREGSFLGWTEAQKNWPVFWQSVWQKQGKK